MKTIIDIIKTSERDQTHRTPDYILDIVRLVDPITLDPCADEERQFASNNFTEVNDGLNRDWTYFVNGGMAYVNPPYNNMGKWIEKSIYESGRGAQILMLGPSKTGPKWFRDAWYHSDAICFWSGRITFLGESQGAYFDSVFFYWGNQPYKFCDVFSPYGIVQKLR